MSTGLNDNEIISKVLSGDQQAYSLLVSRYQNFVFTLVLRFVKSREDAEEVAQDVFIKAYRALADFKGASKFSTWLYTIVNTTSLSFLRKKKLEVHSLDNERVFEVADSIDSGMQANQIEARSRVDMVNKAIGLLGGDDAEIITLFYKGEQSLDEIAQILGIEPNTAKVRLHRARGRLKEKMETHFVQEVKDLNTF
ncbi:MAG: sigma-70 family RNA polymerase sigma factor [Sphingobacteriales bacterium]|nr:sigma-70 family RNA polymerase sigma factor [Sphingobacteriales bacterium]OJW30362.1 MAG: RNA polymerase subunit sigma [Sphingobacteriales bacterium 46-32]